MPRASRDCAGARRRRAPHDHEAVAFEARDEAFRDDRRHQLGRLRFRQTAVARQSEGDARAEVLGAGRREVVVGLRHPPTIAGEREQSKNTRKWPRAASFHFADWVFVTPISANVGDCAVSFCDRTIGAPQPLGFPRAGLSVREVSGSSCQRARARGSRRTDPAMGACTDSALSARAIGGAETDKLAIARSASAAAAPATRAALNGRTG